MQFLAISCSFNFFLLHQPFCIQLSSHDNCLWLPFLFVWQVFLSCLTFFAITVLQSKLYFFVNQFRRRHQLLSCWLKSLWFSILCDFCNRFRLFLVSQQIFWSFMSFDTVFVSPEIVFSGRTQRLHQTDCFFIISLLNQRSIEPLTCVYRFEDKTVKTQVSALISHVNQ